MFMLFNFRLSGKTQKRPADLNLVDPLTEAVGFPPVRVGVPELRHWAASTGASKLPRTPGMALNPAYYGIWGREASSMSWIAMTISAVSPIRLALLKASRLLVCTPGVRTGQILLIFSGGEKLA